MLEKGEAGRTYDVASGEAVSIQTILEGLAARLGDPPSIEVDETRTRPGEAPRIAGDPTALMALGWAPKYSLDQLLDAVVEA